MHILEVINYVLFQAEECNKKLQFLEEKWNRYLDTVDIAAKESVVANIMEEGIVDQPVNLVSVGYVSHNHST